MTPLTHMKRLFTLLLTIIFVLPLYAQEFDGQSCTALMVGKKASADGSGAIPPASSSWVRFPRWRIHMPI